jgi:MFS family permease
MSTSAENEASAAQTEPARWGYFVQRVILPFELPSIMRKHIFTGALGNIWFSLIGGIFFVYFGTAIGLSSFQWGLMSAISAWLIAAQLVSAVVTQRTGKRKLIWFIFAVCERGMRLVAILAALWLWQEGIPHAAIVLIVGICLSNFLGTMSTPPWMSWLADIIPEHQHGTFWGRREGWIALSVLAVALPAGFLVDRFPPNNKIHIVTLIFIGATIVGLMDLVIHGTIPEPAMAMPERNHFMGHVLEPLRDCNFRPWLVFTACWNYAVYLGGSLATIYFLDGLRLKENFLGSSIAITAFSLLGSLFLSRWSGKLVDRIGTKRVLLWGHILWGSLPALWLFATPRTALLWIGLSNLVGGSSCSAATTATNKLVTRLPPPEHRAMYVAVSSSLGSLAGGLGVLTAGIILRQFGDWSYTTCGLTIVGFHFVFLLSLCLRLTSAIWLIPRIGNLGCNGFEP